MIAERVAVDLVHFGEIAHISQKNGRFDDRLEGSARAFEDGGEVSEHLLRLLGDAAGDELHRLRVEGDLAGGEDQTTMNNRLAVGPNGGRCVFRMDSLEF